MRLNKDALEYAKKMVTGTDDYQELDSETKFQFNKCLDIVILNYVLGCDMQLQSEDVKKIQ